MNKKQIQSYFVAVLVVVIAIVATELMFPLLSHSCIIFFLAAVAFSTWYGGIEPGLVTIILVTLSINYFFLSPGDQLISINYNDFFLLSIFAIVATFINFLNGNHHQSQEQS